MVKRILIRICRKSYGLATLHTQAEFWTWFTRRKTNGNAVEDDSLSPTAARYKDEYDGNDEESLTMDEDVRRERMRVLTGAGGGSAEDVLQVL